ncbi:MAG: SAM-dependent chlorinase/fluorinase [Treponema sp.]|jgi:S-adenosylmethionine hydrolase|nr:SAM-dependent chlorinase/fluorinase [Treponema sp.]
MNRKPILVFQTDFTYKEGAVSAMYGVVKTVDRDLEIFDGSHELPKFDIWSASYRLYQSMEFWPKGTIFVSVVDPGVGTGRRAAAARTTNGYTVVTPDNGSLTHTAAKIGIAEIREIDERVNRLDGTRGVSVFHGRDLFGYCAARLASGIITFEETGPAYSVDDIKRLPIIEPSMTGPAENREVRGIFEIDDPNFGNMWTNIPLAMFTEAGFSYGDTLRVIILHGGKVVFDENVLFAKSFGYAEKGKPVIYNNELMNIAMAVAEGNCSAAYGLGYGAAWEVVFTKS